jgi:hypothetical protein
MYNAAQKISTLADGCDFTTATLNTQQRDRVSDDDAVPSEVTDQRVSRGLDAHFPS